MLTGARQKTFEFSASRLRRAAQEYKQTTLGEVHVVVAQATDMSRAEMLARIDALESGAEQSWTSHQVMFLYELKSVAG